MEIDGKKRAAETSSTMSCLDKALELILNLEEDKPLAVAPLQTNYFSKLKSFEPELKPNPPKPIYNQQSRFVPPSAVQAPVYHQQPPPERKPTPVYHQAPERKPVYQPPVKREPEPEPARVNGNNNAFRTAKDQLVHY